MAVTIARKRFTIDDYRRMAEAGILTEDDRVELIDGEIVEMSPIGKHHAGVVNRLTALLHRVVGASLVIAVQNPIYLRDDLELQPDIAVLKFRDDYYAEQLPTPADTLLIIEVADTSLAYDRDLKVPRYASGGVPEVWLVNLPEGVIEVCREPAAAAYRDIRQVRRGEMLSLPGVPHVHISVDDILGNVV